MLIAVPLGTFTRWQVLGGLVWTVELCGAGYLIGNSVTNIDRYLLPIVAVIVLVSLTPLAVEAYRARRARRARRAQRSPNTMRLPRPAAMQ